jgi:predicted unusual protein kinase regulating ubiquinone biosynthesis (AarF/ABC1/UbiB family)
MKKIKTGLFQRSFAKAKLSLKSGALAAKQLVGTDKEEYLIQQMKLLSEELGELKGSLMKVGQTISMYGEHFLPPKANEYLKNLQSDSPKLPWEQIKLFLDTEIGTEKLKNLEIDHTAIAAASLGQVHKAFDKISKKEVAIKIQYPGVEKAIKSDLRALKSIFSLAQIIPSSPRTDQFFEEIETMLIQETNYDLERIWTQQIYKKLKDDSRFVVPEVLENYSSRHVLTTSFEPGEKIDSEKVQRLSQDRRNELALSFLDLYYKELFEFKLVQTDPHLGNYRIRINESGQDQIVLYDFGAMREVPDHFGNPFKNLVRAAADKDKDTILKCAYEMKYLFVDDSEDLKNKYFEMCCLIGEPFAENPENSYTDKDGNYDWKHTDLPKRVAVIGKEILKNHKLRVPPRESIFLDRKLGGAFIFASVIGLNGKSRTGLMKYFKN